MLNATCNDLTDPDNDDSPAHNDDPGYDVYSGYGLIDIYMALSHGNLQRDQWSNHTLISNNSVNYDITTSTPAHRQAIAIDSQGFSHAVWIDNRLDLEEPTYSSVEPWIDDRVKAGGSNAGEVYYSSVQPSGRNWTSDTSLEVGHACQLIASSYVDLFIDNFDNIHVCWLDDNNIYYTRLDPQGTPNLPQGNPSIIQVTNSASSPKEYLNIITDDEAVPSIYFYYNIQDTTQGNDWDVAWSQIIVNGQEQYQVTHSDTILIPTDSNLRRVYADVGLVDFNQERVFLVYQDDANSNWDVEWRQYDLSGALESQMHVANTEDDETDPHIDVSYEHGGSAIVWRRSMMTYDELYYRLIAPGRVDFTYGQMSYQIGYRYARGMWGGKEYPKVAIAVTQNQIPNPYYFANHEIHVVWRQWDESTGNHAVFHSRCNADGRPFQAPNETSLVDGGYGYPLVTSVDEGSTMAPRYIKDGHFRATWFQWEPGTGTYAIAYRTTNALWKGIRNITMTDDIEKESDLVIDVNGDYHLVWTEEDSSSRREICYANWIDSNPYSAPTTEADITHNGSNTDSYRPKIITFEDSTVIKVVIIWVDEAVNSNGDIWITCFEAEDPSQVDLSPTIVSCSPPDNRQEIDHRIAHDDQNQWIAITWCEDYQSNRGLWLGVVGYDNAQIVQENIVTSSAVYDCYDPSIYIEEQTFTVNIAYVRVYSTYHLVFYTQIYVGMSYYFKYFDNSITSNGYYRFPEIVIDHETRRLEDNSYGIRSDNNNRDRYVHIIYDKIVNESSPQRHALCYQKLFLNATKVIDEKMFLPDDYWWVPTFRSYTHIRSVVRLDVDNRLEIISLAQVFRGNWWPIPSARVSVYYTKIDNNGEILCAEMFINDNEVYDCHDITTAMDAFGQVHVIWTENTNLRYCSNGLYIE